MPPGSAEHDADLVALRGGRLPPPQRGEPAHERPPGGSVHACPAMGAHGGELGQLRGRQRALGGLDGWGGELGPRGERLGTRGGPLAAALLGEAAAYATDPGALHAEIVEGIVHGGEGSTAAHGAAATVGSVDLLRRPHAGAGSCLPMCVREGALGNKTDKTDKTWVPAVVAVLAGAIWVNGGTP